MSTRVERVFEEVAGAQGWDDVSQRAVLEAYIDNQQADGAFQDFLLEQASEEGEDPSDICGPIEHHMGWDDSSMISLMLEYVSRQDADDTFTEHIDQWADRENQELIDRLPPPKPGSIAFHPDLPEFLARVATGYITCHEGAAVLRAMEAGAPLADALKTLTALTKENRHEAQ